MAENLEIGSLSIQIDTQSEIPSKGIKNLADAIGSLKEALKGSFANLRKISQYIKDLGEAINYLPSPKRIRYYTDFFNSLKGMGNFGKRAFKEAMSGAEEYADSVDMAGSSMQNASKNLVDFNKYQDQTFSNEFYDRYKMAMGYFREYTKQFRYLNSNQKDDFFYEPTWTDKTYALGGRQEFPLLPSGDGVKQFSVGEEMTVVRTNLDVIYNKLIAIKGFVLPKIISFTKNIGKRTSVLFNQIKRIALYRVIRTLIREITKTISEGSKAMYRWSESNDKDFVKSMDNIATSFHYLRASVASALNPIVKLIEPIITSLVDGLSNAINTFSKFVAMMNGQNVYAKAIRDAKKYGDTLKAQFLGIDELHKSGDETSFNFVETAIKSTDKMWRFAKNLKEILRSIKEFGGNIVNNIIKPILKVIEQVVRIVVAVLKPVVTSVLDILGVSTKDLGSFFESLTIKLESLANTVEYIMDKYISPIFTTITDVVKITDALANVVMSLLTFNGDKISSAWDNLANAWNNATNNQKNISSQYNYGILSPLQDMSMLDGKDNYFKIEMDGIKVYDGMGTYKKQFGLSGGKSSGGGGHF